MRRKAARTHSDGEVVIDDEAMPVTGRRTIQLEDVVPLGNVLSEHREQNSRFGEGWR